MRRFPIWVTMAPPITRPANFGTLRGDGTAVKVSSYDASERRQTGAAECEI